MRNSLKIVLVLSLLLVVLFLAGCSSLTVYDNYDVRSVSGSAVYEAEEKKEITNKTSEEKELVQIKDVKVDVPHYNGTCFDTDYGVAYTVPGICYDKIDHKAGIKDYCVDSLNVYEYYCSNNPDEGCLRRELHFCNGTNVCYEGRCVDFRKVNKTEIKL